MCTVACLCWVLVKRFASIFTKLIWRMTIFKYTDDAVIIGNIAADADSENYLYLDEIRISLLCKSSDLLLNPTTTN